MTDPTERVKESAPVDRLSQIWRRIYDHKVVQWTVAYVAIAYGLQHGVILASESLGWPGAVARVSILLLVLGLPIVMTFAWYHGARASRNFSQAELSILAALLVVGSLVFYVFVRPMQPVSPPVAQEATVTAARAAAAMPKGAISVAVLPFLNLSSDKEQEFFSDGMTEEITAALAKVSDLRVVARTSAFEFKGKNISIKTMGEQLGATHLIEGSVRKAGNQLRITVQLIKADDGTHVWAEDYDRELTDVFAIQEDIARAITTSLHMTLGLKPGENLINNRSIDPESYNEYLRAKALWIGRLGSNNPDALADFLQAASLLEGVVAKNASYAPAWSLLGAIYWNEAAFHAQNADERIEQSRALASALLDRAEDAEQKALQLDPGLGTAYTGLGVVKWSRGRLAEAGELFAKAIYMDGNDAASLGAYGLRLGAAGRSREALPLIEKVHGLETLGPLNITTTAAARWVNGDDTGAIALAKTGRPTDRARLLALIYASRGRFAEAADALNETAGDPGSATAQAVQLLRRAPARVPAEQLPRLPANLEFIYLFVGAPERAIAYAQRQVDVGFIAGGTLDRIWGPAFAPVRKTERFKTLMRKGGFVDYWRAKGWPDLCHPVGTDDFECS